MKIEKKKSRTLRASNFIFIFMLLSSNLMQLLAAGTLSIVALVLLLVFLPPLPLTFPVRNIFPAKFLLQLFSLHFQHDCY